MPRKYKKLSKRRRLVKKLDQMFSLYIRERDLYCVSCGTDYRLQCGHLFSRVFYATRWDEDNACAQCSGCNMRHEFDPMVFPEKYKELYSPEKFDEVYIRSKSQRKIKDDELEEMYKMFKEKYEQKKEENMFNG